MKTAISVPDRLYREAERHARRTRKSRSQLYAEALTEYLARHAPDEVTDAMNAVVDGLDGSQPDAFLTAARATAARGHEVVVVTQGDIWWAELPEPTGSAPRLRRPVVVVQGNPLNRSRIATVVCIPLTSNTIWAGAPGNVLLSGKMTDLPNDSVANATQIVALDRSLLTERAGRLGPRPLTQILHGIDIVLGR